MGDGDLEILPVRGEEPTDDVPMGHRVLSLRAAVLAGVASLAIGLLLGWAGASARDRVPSSEMICVTAQYNGSALAANAAVESVATTTRIRAVGGFTSAFSADGGGRISLLMSSNADARREAAELRRSHLDEQGPVTVERASRCVVIGQQPASPGPRLSP